MNIMYTVIKSRSMDNKQNQERKRKEENRGKKFGETIETLTFATPTKKRVAKRGKGMREERK